MCRRTPGSVKFRAFTITRVPGRPRLTAKLLALVLGELPAGDLAAYERAGVAVYDLLEEVEARRAELAASHADPWSVEAATQAQFLCAWNAFVLQTLGDSLVEGDYEAHPSTAGYLPESVARQVRDFYDQVGGWLSRARQAASNPGFRFEVYVPQPLPSWLDVGERPRWYVRAMRAANESVRARAALATEELARSAPAEREPQVARLRQILAAATAAADYAEKLWQRELSDDLWAKIDSLLQESLQNAYVLGQLLAMPQLLDEGGPSAAGDHGIARLAVTMRLPGEPGFDPWCLTDPAVKDVYRRDARSQAELRMLWARDPHPERTLAIQAEIDAALARGEINYMPVSERDRPGPWNACPWPAIYLASAPVRIGGVLVPPGRKFTFRVSAGEPDRGGAFRREIVVK